MCFVVNGLMRLAAPIRTRPAEPRTAARLSSVAMKCAAQRESAVPARCRSGALAAARFRFALPRVAE